MEKKEPRKLGIPKPLYPESERPVVQQEVLEPVVEESAKEANTVTNKNPPLRHMTEEERTTQLRLLLEKNRESERKAASKSPEAYQRETPAAPEPLHLKESPPIGKVKSETPSVKEVPKHPEPDLSPGAPLAGRQDPRTEKEEVKKVTMPKQLYPEPERPVVQQEILEPMVEESAKEDKSLTNKYPPLRHLTKEERKAQLRLLIQKDRESERKAAFKAPEAEQRETPPAPVALPLKESPPTGKVKSETPSVKEVPKQPEPDLSPAPPLAVVKKPISDMLTLGPKLKAKGRLEAFSKLALTAKKTFDQLQKEPKDKTNFKKLQAFGIPDQNPRLDKLLAMEPKTFNFGGFLREYFSPALRSPALLNLQGRYRGPNDTTCFTAIDIENLGTKEQLKQQEINRSLNKRDEYLEELRSVSSDEDHFQFLKGLTNMQPLTCPITVYHGILQEVVPCLDEVFQFYLKHLGQDHKCTIEAGEHFVRHRNRLNMYDNL